MFSFFLLRSSSRFEMCTSDRLHKIDTFVDRSNSMRAIDDWKTVDNNKIVNKWIIILVETVPQGLELHHVRHFDWLTARTRSLSRVQQKQSEIFSFRQWTSTGAARGRMAKVGLAGSSSHWPPNSKWDLGHAVCVPKMLTAFLYHLRLFGFDPKKLQGIRSNAFSVDESCSRNRFCLLWRWQRQFAVAADTICFHSFAVIRRIRHLNRNE